MIPTRRPRSPLRTLLPAVLLAAALLGCDRDHTQADLTALESQIRTEYPDTPHWTIEQATVKQPRDAQVVYVDARPADERAVSIIPGAITLDTVQASPDAYRDRPLAVYCTVGYRSAEATDTLVSLGLDAHNLLGGITGWAWDSGPLQTPDGQPTTRVHTYSAKWNYLPPDYDAVW